MGESKPRFYIGTSGWSYDHWKGPFYPADIREGEMLGFYSRNLPSVEINNSFYHLPSIETLAHWCDVTPADFVFSVKASRYITHMKKLRDPQKSLVAFMERIAALADKLGPILFQLPPHWHYNEERLSEFLDSLSRDYRYVFEFRDSSWLNERCYELLAQHGAALCIYELDGYRSPREVTADFVYLRLHGPDGPYQGNYDDKTLSDWADAIARWSADGKHCFCYFDNDEAGYAVGNAMTLQAMLQQQ